MKLSVRLVNFMGKAEIVGSTRIKFDFNRTDPGYLSPASPNSLLKLQSLVQSPDATRCRSLSSMIVRLCVSLQLLYVLFVASLPMLSLPLLCLVLFLTVVPLVVLH